MAGAFNQFEPAKDQPRFVASNGVQELSVPGSSLRLRYAYISQRGFYPDSPDKANQDAVFVVESVGGHDDVHLFGVLDGHGETGTLCAGFAQKRVSMTLSSSLSPDPPHLFNRLLAASACHAPADAPTKPHCAHPCRSPPSLQTTQPC
jgi:hypothetical protein